MRIDPILTQKKVIVPHRCKAQGGTCLCVCMCVYACMHARALKQAPPEGLLLLFDVAQTKA
eukprot:scaffold263465_cov18-Tisochrysis_lutea.AAC.1